MKIFLLTTSLIIAISLSAKQPQPQDSTKTRKHEPIVYICTGGSAYAYHKDKKCQFLNKCSKEIKAITKAKALDLNRKPCKACNR